MPQAVTDCILELAAGAGINPRFCQASFCPPIPTLSVPIPELHCLLQQQNDTQPDLSRTMSPLTETFPHLQRMNWH